MSEFDPRITLARPDFAAVDLQGVIAAAGYAAPGAQVCVVPAAPLRRAPDDAAEQWDQLLFGERFAVLSQAGGWAWGQAARDGYVGHVRCDHLAPAPADTPSHRVSALRTYAFSEPSIKAAPVGLYSLNALVRVVEREGRFARAEASGWFVEAHLAPVGVFETDAAGVTERFLAAPYLWGGRESLGLDCSGLVQQAFFACGRACPRDSDQQARLGQAAPEAALQRGDLVFWPGHVAMMLDARRMIHANALHMAVTVEPLSEAVARIGPPTAYRRI